MSVKLTRLERSQIGRAARTYVRKQGYTDLTDPGVLDAAMDFISGEVDGLGRFEDVPYTEISDYALAMARFLFPHAARYD